MSGVTLRVDLQGADAVKDRFNSLVLRLGDLTPAMDEIGSGLITSTLDRFEKGRGPDGNAWPPSLRATEDHGQTLILSGRLRASITWKATQREVEVGTNVVYAAIHQLGGKAGRGRVVSIPARPYLPDPMPADDEAMINDVLGDYLTGAFR
jgi:phage virion morphogenesis protein